MARTPLFAQLRRSFLLARSAIRAGEPGVEHAERAREAYLSRRGFVRGSAAAVAAAPFAGALFPGCGDPGGSAEVGIIGAGLAGLHCAYRLMQRGIAVDVFDAWNRAGGRTFTARGMLAGNQICELGGELIDTNHVTIRALAAELGLTIDSRVEPPTLSAETFYFGGRVVPLSEIVTAFMPVAAAMDAAVSMAEADATSFEALDNTTIREWLADPANMVTEPLRSILDVAYVGEFGRETDEQSVFNLLYMIDYETTDPFHVFGDSDEIGHTHEGNEAYAEAIVPMLPRGVSLGHRLVALRAGASGRVTAVLDRGGSMIERQYAHLVLALPFLQLRMVDIDAALGFSADKLDAIETLGYGRNSKLMLQFGSKPWREAPNLAGGNAYADNPAQLLWETSIGQTGAEGILTHFAGGDGADLLASGTPDSQAMRVLPFIDAVFPGTMATFNGRALRMDWQAAPFHGGSYACYLPGQTRFIGDVVGVEGTREGNVHFAGEHTSVEAQGFLEGAVESGLRAANEILMDMGMSTMSLVAPALRRRAGRGRIRRAAEQARLSRSRG